MRSVPSLYNEDSSRLVSSLRVSFRHELVSRQSPAGSDVNTRAEESPLLGTVTEQRLVKTITDRD
jgi:hypothetical protein